MMPVKYSSAACQVLLRLYERKCVTTDVFLLLLRKTFPSVQLLLLQEEGVCTLSRVKIRKAPQQGKNKKKGVTQQGTIPNSFGSQYKLGIEAALNSIGGIVLDVEYDSPDILGIPGIYTPSRGMAYNRQRARHMEMFSIQKPEAVPHLSNFHESMPFGSLQFPSDKERKQDSNFNILEESYDKNENWSQGKKGGEEGEKKSKPEDEKSSLDNSRSQLKNRPIGQLKSTGSEGISMSSSEEEVRSPPEGAEIMQLEGDTPVKDTANGFEKWAGSPLEDNGYASSSLSIDSPDSVSGNTWQEKTLPASTTTPLETPETEDSDVESSSDSDSISVTLSEAFQSIQDKEKLKEREKEKHNAQLTMYRRLALLRWIRALQQKLRDQQNRLQESFDTILDNRKEILRHIQHGYNKTPTKETV
ncbi:hypothetical protein XELAEV_18012452mg [Xenopus laevis]|uniref:Uncharacterized protein n=1 Tax=Xenopus laevis TaxID=8355 RepID=A0A974DN47_XENLA|nr:hypothetical protein XELAEV_18012452mg [Xenopus laevis]